MANDLFKLRFAQPDEGLLDFVESFWMIENRSGDGQDIIILPDGMIELTFSFYLNDICQVQLLGIGVDPIHKTFPAKKIVFGISFKLLAIESLFPEISDVVHYEQQLPVDFWNLQKDDLIDFQTFYLKASAKAKEYLKAIADERKRNLFNFIYDAKGAVGVKELSEKVFWTSRQINRYFKNRFGLSLKAYCNILRFRASFPHLKAGKLFPEMNFSDQAHFIKEVKKFSGVIPKELNKNKNDRFIQFSVLANK